MLTDVVAIISAAPVLTHLGICISGCDVYYARVFV